MIPHESEVLCGVKKRCGRRLIEDTVPIRRVAP